MYTVTHKSKSQTFSCSACVDPKQPSSCNCLHDALALSRSMPYGAEVTRNGRPLAVNRPAASAAAKADESVGAAALPRSHRSRSEGRRGSASARSRKVAA